VKAYEEWIDGTYARLQCPLDASTMENRYQDVWALTRAGVQTLRLISVDSWTAFLERFGEPAAMPTSVLADRLNLNLDLN
jgi:hypothetical protein